MARDHRHLPRRLPWGGAAVVAAGVVVLVLLVTRLGGLLPGIGNPFSTETVDRSGPAVLEAIQDISEYRAATGNFQVIVDLEEDTRFVPSEIRGERTLFVAAGTVDAGVDLSQLGADDVEVSDDRRSVTLTLAPPRLYEAQVDPERSYVVSRDRGLLDRVGGLFSDSPTGERELFIAAEERIAAAAAETRLTDQAATNTRATLETLLRSLGFERVEVRFAEPPPT
jgi:hypothetical protein